MPSLVTDTAVISLRNFIAARKWQYARTYAKSFPHEYTVRNWHPDEAAFQEFVQLIRTHGEARKFFSKTYIYMEFDGHKYWTMGAPIPDTTVLNREPLSRLNEIQ